MALLCAAATGTNTILAIFVSIAGTAALVFWRALFAIACAPKLMKNWIPADPFFVSKNGFNICLVSSALITVIIIKLLKKHKGVDSNRCTVSTDPRRSFENLSMTRRNLLKETAEPLNPGLTISQASSSALSEPRSIVSSATIIEQQHTEHSVITTGSASTKPKNCNTIKTLNELEFPALKGILVSDSLPEQLDESVITSSPTRDVVLRFDDFKLPGRPKGGRTGLRRNANGKVSTCSIYRADKKTQAILAESFARSVKTNKPLEAWQRQDLNTLADNEQLEFFTVEGLKTFVAKNKLAPVTSFMITDQHPSMLHLSQCVIYLVGVFPFVASHESLLTQLQTIVKHAQKMAIHCTASSPGSAFGLQALRLRLARFMEIEVEPALRAFQEYEELGLHDMEDFGTSARWKRLKSGHKIRKLVQHIRNKANSAQGFRNELLAEFADLMIDYYKQIRESKKLHVDEDACLRVRSVFNQAV